MKKTLLASGLTACFLLLALCGNLLAQGTSPIAPATKLLPCDEAVKMATVDAQARANADCRTIHYCTSCIEAATKKETCRPVTAHPSCTKAGTVSGPVMKPTGTSFDSKGKKSDAVPAMVEPFEVIVVQSVCFNNGVTLESYITGADAAVAAQDRMASAKARQAGYTSSWTVDSKKMGNSTRLDCVCGKEAVLTVTDNATKKTVTRTVKMPAACGTGSTAARIPSPNGGGINEGEIVAAFSKSSCYGSCPVYKVQFYSNGTASWDGYMNVARMGHFEMTLGPDALARIQEKAFAVKYFDFAPKYPTNFTVYDAPSTITYIRAGSKENQVENIMESPEKLIEFETFLYDEIVKLGWKADPPVKKAAEVMKATAPSDAPKN